MCVKWVPGVSHISSMATVFDSFQFSLLTYSDKWNMVSVISHQRYVVLNNTELCRWNLWRPDCTFSFCLYTYIHTCQWYPLNTLSFLFQLVLTSAQKWYFVSMPVFHGCNGDCLTPQQTPINTLSHQSSRAASIGTLVVMTKQYIRKSQQDTKVVWQDERWRSRQI